MISRAEMSLKKGQKKLYCTAPEDAIPLACLKQLAQPAMLAGAGGGGHAPCEAAEPRADGRALGARGRAREKVMAVPKPKKETTINIQRKTVAPSLKAALRVALWQPVSERASVQ